MFAQEAFGKSCQAFAGFREKEATRGFRPVELETGRLGGDPNLANGGVGGKDELSGAIFKKDVEDTVLFFSLESTGFLGRDERLLEGGQGVIGFAAEGSFVDG